MRNETMLRYMLKNYNHFTEEEIENYLAIDFSKIGRPDGESPVRDDELARVSKIVFALDPETMSPQSDISYLLSSGDDDFKEYIKNMLFKDNPLGDVADNVDDAEAVVHKNLMTFNEYEQALRDYVIKQNRQVVESEV